MNLCVWAWWYAGPGCSALCRRPISFDKFWKNIREEARVKNRCGVQEKFANPDAYKPKLSTRRMAFRAGLRKIFRAWSDTQAVTGIALLFAAIFQGNGGDLSQYHTAIVLDLISIAADGQAIMLFYALKAETAKVRTHTIADPDPQVVQEDTTKEVPSGCALTPIETGVFVARGAAAGTAHPPETESSLNLSHERWPRLLSGLLFVVLYFVFAFKAYFHLSSSEGCFLSSKPRTGNYGVWAIATAILVLFVYVPIYLPLGRPGRWLKGLIIQWMKVSYPASGRGSGTFYAIWRSFTTLCAGLLWLVACVSRWLLDTELSFPIGSLIYFLWNTVDVFLLKQTNEVLLLGDGVAEENTIDAFGQIIPIVMAFAMIFPITDTMDGKEIQIQDRKMADRPKGKTWRKVWVYMCCRSHKREIAHQKRKMVEPVSNETV